MSYTPKELVFDEKAKRKLKSGITKICNAVKSTLGPAGKTVVIESPNHTRGITVTKDGVTVAKSVYLLDPVENLAVQMIREASQNTADSAGDGTTTSIVLAEALIEQGLEELEEQPDINIPKLVKQIGEGRDKVVKELERMAKKLNKKRLLDVASISANNDREIGKIIAEAYEKVGADGVVTVENSETSETYAEVYDGIKLKRGYTNNAFINNHKRDECVLENCYVLITDHVINNVLQIENILKPIINQGKELLIIADCSQNVVNTLAANAARNGLKICNISPPKFGYKKQEIMGDIALATGGSYISESTGDDLNMISLDQLGIAEKVIVSREDTVMIGGKGDKVAIEQRVKELKVQHGSLTAKGERDFVTERIASLKGGIGVIFVGGHSDIEQKEKFDRIEDAVCAVSSALEEGVLPGGGVSLYRASSKLMDTGASFGEILLYRYCITEPFFNICKNAGMEDMEIAEIETLIQNSEVNMGYDVKNNMWGDMYKMGILDPLKVTKNALVNAVSVATTILSTNAIITMAREVSKGE